MIQRRWLALLAFGTLAVLGCSQSSESQQVGGSAGTGDAGLLPSGGLPHAGGSAGGAPAAGAGGATAGAATGGSNGGGETSAGGAGMAGAGTAGAANAGGNGGASCGNTSVAPVYPGLTWDSDADTVALYRMSDVADTSPSGLVLTNTGAVTFTHDGLDWSGYSMNAVAQFSGADQSLSRAGLTVGSDFTLEARVRWSGFQDRACGQAAQIIALKSGTSGVAFEQPCGLASGPRVRVNDTTEIVSAAQLDEAQDYAWHSVAFVISAGSASFYLDGVKLGTSAAVSSLGTFGFTLTLGRFFSGELDELRLSKVARVPSAAGPSVQARPAYSELLGAGQVAKLTATLSGGTAPHVVWSKLSGPGDVAFSDPNAASTSATFCAAGKYVLQALTYDAAFTNNDYVVVRVWPATGRDNAYKTLFLGNSFSFYNGTVGYRYWELAKQAGEDVGASYAQSPYVKMMTSPGQTFQYHWFEANSNSECTSCTDHVLPAPPTVNLTDYTGKNAQAVIRDGGWDVVFLHSYSTAPLTEPEVFARYGKKFDRLIKRSGARTVFYQTWAYPAEPTTLTNEETLLGNYEKLAQQTGAALSKVGRAFQDARQNHGGDAAWPNGIFFTDSKHPSSFATYLAGAVHYATVYGKTPAALTFYPGVGDVPAPEMTKDMPRADLMRTLAAKLVPATPLEQGK